MDLIETVEQYIASFIDVSMTHNEWETDTGKHFTTFYINRRGTVLQFVAPYPTTDEEEINRFMKNLEREI